MEELFLSGYCAQLDQARLVEAEVEDGRLCEVDCLFETCVYRERCEIGKKLRAQLSEEVR